MGKTPSSVAVGDFNGDGKLDLAITSLTNNTVSILLGDGQGGFGRATAYPAGPTPKSVTAGDFNGDGKLDLAAANGSSGTISVLLGNGDGSFQTPIPYQAGTDIVFVSAGDLNGDGKTDLVGADSTANMVAVLLNNGGGTFQTPRTTLSGGGGPRSLALGDFNGDGKLDVAEANVAGAGNLSILTGKGDGTFQHTISYTESGAPAAVIAADFNGDGELDLAVATYQTSPNERSRMLILLGSGDGTFQQQPQFYSIVDGDFPAAEAVGDFNGDGKPDLALAGGSDASSLGAFSVFLGHGDGTFREGYFRTAGPNAPAMAAADFDADGRSDLALANQDAGNVSIYLGGSQQAVDYSISFASQSVAIADFNGDGQPDVAVGNQQHQFVSVLLGKPNGTLGPSTTYATGTGTGGPAMVAVADFNGDGKPDLVAANNFSTSIYVFFGNGDGTFQPAVFLGSGSNIAVGDFNGDGKQDLAVCEINSVQILLGNGDGTFQAPITYALGKVAVSLAAADFNHDGKLDLAVGAADNLGAASVAILLGNGHGSFQQGASYAIPSQFLSVAAADFNKDGKPDLVVTSTATFYTIPALVTTQS